MAADVIYNRGLLTSRDGRELYFDSGDGINAPTKIITEEDFSPDTVINLFTYMTALQKADVRGGYRAVDISSAFVRALADGYPIYVPHRRGWVYRIDSSIEVPSDSWIISDGAFLWVRDQMNASVFIINGGNNIELRGMQIDGNRAHNNAASGSGVLVTGAGGTEIKVRNMRLFNMSDHGISIGGTTVYGINALENYCFSNYSGGVTALGACGKFKLDDNHTWLNGTHGVGILGSAKNGSMSGNVSWDNGQGTPNADNITGYNAANENLVIAQNVTTGGLNNGIHVGGSKLIVALNTTYAAGQYGLAVWPATGAGDDVTVKGNQNYKSKKSGLWLQNCNSGTLAENISRDCIEHGMLLDNCTDIEVGLNRLRGNGADGLRIGTTCSYLTIVGNGARSNAGAGLNMSNLTHSTVSANNFRSNTGWGIQGGGAEAENLVTANRVRANGAGQIQALAASTDVLNNKTT